MNDYLTLWWVWVCIALALGVVELLAPGFIFLGFAIGALVVAGLVAVVTFSNVAALMAVFALMAVQRRDDGSARKGDYLPEWLHNCSHGWS